MTVSIQQTLIVRSLRRDRCAVKVVLLSLFILGLGGNLAVANDAATEQFEKEIRPLFIEHCIECHSQDNDSGDLIIDSLESLLKGGETGAAIKPGHAEESRIIQAVRRVGELKMPPEESLSEQQIRSLVKWVEAGAVWPKTSPSLADSIHQNARKHWAFQKVVKPNVPQLENAEWLSNPIDAFVLRKLREHKLAPSSQADKRTLLRRVSYTLTGLPPNSQEVQQFENDSGPQAYKEAVERLLSSDQYGEQWARHWLDVARYSDTKGYVYAREERFWPHAWAYRDWVVQALNNDVPYDRFLLLQLAADQVEDRQQADLAAMGFLTLGRRFLGVNHLIIDDRIDVVCRGTMGLTVGCARCHDHKYDPIPTADYYSLFGVFNSSSEELLRLSDEKSADETFETDLEKKMETLETKLAERREESSKRARSRIRDYLVAQTDLGKYPQKGFDQIFAKTDLLPEFVWRWERHLDRARRNSDPIFLAWNRFAALPEEKFTEQAISVTNSLQESSPTAINSVILALFTTPPKTFLEVIDRYAGLFESIQDEAEVEDFSGAFESPAKQAIRNLLFGTESPSTVPEESIVHTEFFFDSGTVTELWKLQGEVDRLIVNASQNVPFALTLKDRPTPKDPQILIRGNLEKAGRVVPRQFLKVLSGEEQSPFQHGSGRLEFAKDIIDPENPLTARVIVNRVWTHHFGQGLVSTPSDFGTRAETPSHPELLDWLTTWFIEEGWSLKKLHHLILTSSTYQQASEVADTKMAVQANQIDPGNRLLWRMNAHRMTFEEFRDSLLNVSGELKLHLGGKPKDLFKKPFPVRRTLYGLVDRQYLPGTLRVFDFANPDLHIPKRSETTVPQQALFYLNHPIVLEQVQSLVNQTEVLENSSVRVAKIFERTLQRKPSDEELAEAMLLITSAEQPEQSKTSPTAADWSYGYGKFDEATVKVLNFQQLPHFTGTAWQGGPSWPDSKLGWVQLTATGGHPGNDREHAAIRRWTAPHDGEFKIETKLVHEPAPGDGIRTFIVSSKQGLLGSKTIHQSTADVGVHSITVSKSETIDFVVDIGDVLNSDQYLWSVNVQELATKTTTLWDSKEDFKKDDVNQLTPWEQLAHVLICTNEFLFID